MRKWRPCGRKPSGAIEIRQLSHLDEFTEVLRLQQVIWGFADVELLPLRFLVVVSKVGGHVFGAFDRRPHGGILLRHPGREAARAALPAQPHAGCAAGLSQCGHRAAPETGQREEALSRGIELIEWTFDPLELKNAYLNIERLGAIVRRYNPNQYGVTTSPLHGGLPTDRCIAEWWLDSPRVRATLAGRRWSGMRCESAFPYPADIAQIRSQEPRRAREVQAANAEKFLDAFSRGLAVTGFEAARNRGNLLIGALAMKIERIALRQIRMPLVHFFETSFSRTYGRDIVLVEVQGEGLSGWGEVTAGENPFYNEEWTGSAWPILRDYVAPRVLGREFKSAEDVYPLTAHIRGHKMARGGLEAAVWDLAARQDGVPLWKKIGGGARREIPCGVSIGIQDSVEQLLEKIAGELAAGYQRIKMKIKPGWDVDVVRQVRERFPVDQADGGREFRLYAGRRRPFAAAGRFLPDDDRTAAGARRHYRSRRTTVRAENAHLP